MARNRNAVKIVQFRHWLPILTICPENNLPDLIYVTLEFENEPDQDLYWIRKTIRKAVSGRKAYMERIAQDLLDMFPMAVVTVRLAFGRHVVTVFNEVEE